MFASYGAAFGGLGVMLLSHQQVLLQVLGVLTILLGLLFAGAFDRFALAGRATGSRPPGYRCNHRGRCGSLDGIRRDRARRCLARVPGTWQTKNQR